MSGAEPRLFADGRGVWRIDKGQSYGIEWGDVYCVSGSKLDGITEVYTCIILDWEYGESIEFYDGWAGFEQVVSEITTRLAGIDPDWFRKIEQLSIGEPPVEVWRRI